METKYLFVLENGYCRKILLITGLLYLNFCLCKKHFLVFNMAPNPRDTSPQTEIKMFTLEAPESTTSYRNCDMISSITCFAFLNQLGC